MASLLFFVSGGTGLAYQVVWFKRFSHVWGSSSLAFAAVGGSFLFGLGLGAYLIGRVADRMPQPLRWYGVCELAIGLLALVIPFEIAALADASVSLYAAIPEEPVLRFLVQFAITLLVIGPPCMLMGGTLPLLIRQLTARDGSLDQATAWLYAINTFGAAAGCYLTGFHLLPALGLLTTNNLAAAINLSIGVVSLAVSGVSTPVMPRRDVSPIAEGKGDAARLARLYFASALTGCAALALEMTWTRQLALIVGGSTYAYTATLFVVLVGIALGSLIFHFWLRPVASWSWLPVVIIGGSIAATVLGNALLPDLSMWMAPDEIREWRSDPLGNGVVCVAVSAVLEFLPAVGMGLLFPLFVHLTHASAARVGQAVGNIYAWNTLGSIVGASLTSLLLFSRIGTAGSIALAVGLYVVALLAMLSWRSPLEVFRGVAVGLVGAAAVAFVAQPFNPLDTNMGLYMYGNPAKVGGGPLDPNWRDKIEMLSFEEGASSNVLVSKATQVISLRVNGKVDASSGADMATQMGAAYFPRMFKPDAKEVLVIGFGSGCTPGGSLMFPDTRVTCCEIEPAVYAASKQFAEQNHRPQEYTRTWLEARNSELPPEERLTPEEITKRARFSMIFGDGRTAVQGSGKKYDLIISEPSNPWLAGVSNLFTKEFFRTAREHLTEDGVLAQWIQTYSFTLTDYLMIVRTMHSEFPHFGIILLANGLDTVLLASNRPLLPTADNIAAVQKMVDADPEIASDLQRYLGAKDLRALLARYYQLGEDQIEPLLKEDPSQLLNTDLHLRLEFDAPLHLFRKLKQQESATAALLKAVDPKWIERLAIATGVKRDSPEFRSMVAEYYRSIAILRTTQKREGEAMDALRELIRLVPGDASAHAELAQRYLHDKQLAEAVEHFREALRARPDVGTVDGSNMWANNLAWILATSKDAKLRNGEEAVLWATKSCAADQRKNPATLDTLAAALAEAGRFEEAIRVAEEVLALAKSQPAVVQTTQDRIRSFKESKPIRE